MDFILNVGLRNTNKVNVTSHMLYRCTVYKFTKYYIIRCHPHNLFHRSQLSPTRSLWANRAAINQSIDWIHIRSSVYAVNACGKAKMSWDTPLAPSVRKVSAGPQRKHDVITLQCRRATVWSPGWTICWGWREFGRFRWRGGRQEAACAAVAWGHLLQYWHRPSLSAWQACEKYLSCSP